MVFLGVTILSHICWMNVWIFAITPSCHLWTSWLVLRVQYWGNSVGVGSGPSSARNRFDFWAQEQTLCSLRRFLLLVLRSLWRAQYVLQAVLRWPGLLQRECAPWAWGVGRYTILKQRWGFRWEVVKDAPWSPGVQWVGWQATSGGPYLVLVPSQCNGGMISGQMNEL